MVRMFVTFVTRAPAGHGTLAWCDFRCCFNDFRAAAHIVTDTEPPVKIEQLLQNEAAPPTPTFVPE
jgi:hypothetical protein